MYKTLPMVTASYIQAVNAADYAVAQFRYLSVLLLKHGRFNYIRMCHLICFIFYKNILMSTCQFWFNFNCGFSGQKVPQCLLSCDHFE